MRYPLNACDYHFQVLQRGDRAPLQCRFKAVMGFDVDGAVSGDHLQAAMSAAIREFPVLAGRLRFSLLLARPAWHVDAVPSIQDMYQFEDASAAADCLVAADTALDRAASGSIDLSKPPIVRLHHIRTREFDRILLVWPHPLMDGQGGYEVLQRLAQGAQGGAFAQSATATTTTYAALDGTILSRVPRAIRGYRDQRTISQFQTTLPPTGTTDPSGRVRIARHLGTAADFGAVAAAAKRLSPQGPGLYARHLAACTLRALRRLYDAHGWSSPEYAISFPMRPGGVSVRGMPLGNYLVSAALRVAHDHVLDWPRLGAAIAAQVAAFSTTGRDLDQWALLKASSRMRPGQYHWMMKSSVAKTPLISGYSYFQAEADAPVEQFADRTVLRDVFGGVVVIPPGWNPAFWRHGRRLSMTLAWPGGFIDDELAMQFASLIETEALG